MYQGTSHISTCVLSLSNCFYIIKWLGWQGHIIFYTLHNWIWRLIQLSSQDGLSYHWAQFNMSLVITIPLGKNVWNVNIIFWAPNNAWSHISLHTVCITKDTMNRTAWWWWMVPTNPTTASINRKIPHTSTPMRMRASVK